MKIWSVLIIFAVFSVVASSATFVVKMSLTHRGSSLAYAVRLPLAALAVLKTALPSPHAQETGVDWESMATHTVQIAAAPSPEPCSLKTLTDVNSLVDYLGQKHLNNSFEVRAELAAEYGIPNYTGSIAENRELLHFLSSEEETLPSECLTQTAKH